MIKHRKMMPGINEVSNITRLNFQHNPWSKIKKKNIEILDLF